MGREPRNRAERRAALRKTRRAAGAAMAAGSAALGTTAGVLHLTATPAGAATVTVDTTADGDDGECVVDCTLREAIATAISGDTIEFGAGVTGGITLLGAYGGQLVIDKNLVITGPGAANLYVDGDNTYRVFYIYDAATNLTVTISGITIQNGDASDGGGILNDGENLTLTNTVVTGNVSSADGGGLATREAGGTDPTTALSGTTVFYDNYAEGDGGGVFIESGSLTVNAGVVINANAAGDDGGGIYLYEGQLNIGAATITDNRADDDGGGIFLYSNSTPTTITGASITGNEAYDSGGGVFLYHPDYDVTFTNTLIANNVAEEGSGGGIYLDHEHGGALVITGSTVRDNRSESNQGGGIALYHPGDVLITNTTISGNYAEDAGGGLYLYSAENGSTLSIQGSTITNNGTDGRGGGIFLYEIRGPLDIANTTISNNTAAGNAGGIYVYGTAYTYVRTIRNTTISGNTAGGFGGGVNIEAVDRPIEFFNSTISGNTADEGGGLVLDSSSLGLDLVQTTVTDNHVRAGGTTGGIYLNDLGPLSTTAPADKAQKQAERAAAETKTANGPDEDKLARPPHTHDEPQGDDDESIGAQQVSGPDQIALVGSIVSGNDGLDIGGGGPQDDDEVLSDHSLIGTVAAHAVITDLSGTIFSTNPGLAPLANNGGPTQTHALLGASLAIDAGPTPLVPFPGSGFDQRGAGFARVINGRVDIGAYEAPLLFPDFTG